MNFSFLASRGSTGRSLAYSALLAGISLPWPSTAQVIDGGPQQADGTLLEVAPGDYSTTESGDVVLSAINGGRLTTAGKTRVFSTGVGAIGAAAWGAGSHIALRDTKIRTRGDSGTGVDLRYGGSASAERFAIDTDGDYAHGASIDGANGQLSLTDGVIVTRGKEAYGIMANLMPGGTIVVADTLIRTNGLFGIGVSVSYGGARATLDRTDIRTSGDYASALFLPGASAASFNDSHLETAGDYALGVDTREGRVDLTRTRVVTGGRSAHGLYASKEYSETPVVDAADTHVTTTGARSIGALARFGGKVTMTRGGIATSGERARGVLSSGTGSTVTLADMTIDTHGAEADALYASAGGMIDLFRTDTRATGAGSHAAAIHGGTLTVDEGSLVSERHGAIYASNADLTLRNGTRAVGGNGTLLFVRAETGAPVRLSLETGAQAEGNIANLSDDDGNPTPAVTDVALSGASAWAGATDAVRTLSLDSGSRWTITGASTVGSIVLNDSAIAFAAPGAGTPRSLVVNGDYTVRDGRLLVYTTLHDDTSPTDKLVIDGGHASGNTTLVVKHSGGSGAQTTVGIPLVETRNGGTTDVTAFALDTGSDGYRRGFGTLSAGGYDYMLARGGRGGHEDDWYLVSAAKPEPPVDPETIPPPRTVAPEPDAYLANADAAAAMAIHTLRQREDRSLRADGPAAGPLDGAGWMRAEGQFTSMSGGARSVSGNGRLLHAGADLLRFDDGRGGRIRVGAMGLYGSQTSWSTRALWNAAEQRTADATARGSVEGYNVGLYGTWYGSHDILSGPYVDAWLLYGAYANRVGGSLAGDSYRSRTVTGSLEAGHSFRFYTRGDTRFFVEPQAQLVVSDYRATAHATAGGYLDGQGSTDVLTRVGVRVHGVTAVAPGRELRPYVEASWWHGPGSRSLTLDGNTFSFSVPRDRAAFRIGATGQVSKRFAVSAGLGIDANLSDYAVVKGEFAAKYRW
ncbi:autotransporter outer membrane beta-barrel domain-containing protein [Burkholderia contaminans]|uniref:Autotransporter outer membrane beta-barrel domain-containing protein n=1 Tax=Burkholderia contaminans TaxID=488447 RepID=A0A3N8PM43_9BURK|nr:autotransporter outer membrane beta-barrel domain-containing protein [Burkholderia contaminans]RQT12200.1 autotransporter outer membrane beta-barrel domain-containing protein [Burkholderia contaminans]